MKVLYPLFLDHIRGSSLILPGDTIVLAFSGGKDSVSLLLLLQRLKQDIDFDLLAAYFNHHIRGDAGQEETWVKDFCASRGIPLRVGGGDVPAVKAREKSNLEQAAAMMRSRFLEEVRAPLPGAKIATAHQRTDLVETFFIKLFRGSGSQGLSALFERIGEKIIRPLLIFSEEDIRGFLERNRIDYYRDYTNEEERFLRNRIRRQLLPDIKKLSPQIETHIAQTVSLLQEEYAYFSGLAARFLSERLILKRVLPVKPLADCPLALQRHILREYIRLVKGNLLEIDFSHINGLLDHIHTRTGAAIPGIELKFHKGFIFPQDFSIPAYGYRLDLGQSIYIEEIEKWMTAEQIDRFEKPLHHWEMVAPLSAMRFPLTIRSPLATDAYLKINAAFPQPVFEMIRVAGFPVRLRPLCPVVIDAIGRIIWVAGSPLAEPFKVTALTPGPVVRIRCAGR